MKVEIWSDFACPFCYMGKRHFEQALGEVSFADEVEVVYRSFELDPQAKRDTGLNMHTLLAQKYGMSTQQAKSMNDQVAERARAVGLTYNFETMVPTNTFDAHRLTHLAGEYDKMYDMAERLFRAYFTDGKNIGDVDTLANLAEDVGLSRNAALEVLQGTQYADAVRANETEAQSLGITGVPFFVIDRKYAVSGAQPVEVFVDALTRARDDT